jgi:hypothetical protein
MARTYRPPCTWVQARLPDLPAGPGIGPCNPMQLINMANHLIKFKMTEMLKHKQDKYSLAQVPDDFLKAWKVPLDISLAGTTTLRDFVARVAAHTAVVQLDEDGVTELLIPADSFVKEGTIYSLM